MHPSVGSPFDRTVPKGGAVLNGYFIPEGMTVGITGWVTQRDKAVFGEDADYYRPERWLEVDEKQVRIMDKNMLAVSIAILDVLGSSLTIRSGGRATEVV
jgi:cytochrome P450